MIVSIKGLPSKQFQEIKKKIRQNADVSVAKKNILIRVIEGFGKDFSGRGGRNRRPCTE